MNAIVFFLLDVWASFQVWWTHRVNDLVRMRAQVLNGYIVSVVKYDIATCERTTWHALSWFDTGSLLVSNWLGWDSPVKDFLLNEFHGPHMPNTIYEVTMGDGTIALTRDDYVHQSNDRLAVPKHKYLYCTFDNGLDVTDYINARWKSLTLELGITARDLQTLVQLSKSGKSHGRSLPMVNKMILRIMHGMTLDVLTFEEDENVVLNNTKLKAT